MRTIRLRSMIGPHELVRRIKTDTEYRKEVYSWSFDNNFRCELPVDFWEQMQDKWLDNRTQELRYRQAFIPT